MEQVVPYGASWRSEIGPPVEHAAFLRPVDVYEPWDAPARTDWYLDVARPVGAEITVARFDSHEQAEQALARWPEHMADRNGLEWLYMAAHRGTGHVTGDRLDRERRWEIGTQWAIAAAEPHGLTIGRGYVQLVNAPNFLGAADGPGEALDRVPWLREDRQRILEAVRRGAARDATRVIRSDTSRLGDQTQVGPAPQRQARSGAAGDPVQRAANRLKTISRRQSGSSRGICL